jgi:hypothetical protein
MCIGGDSKQGGRGVCELEWERRKRDRGKEGVWERRCQFQQHFTRTFFVQKCFAQLFSTYILALYFFGKRILAQKMHVKCWWNGLKESKVEADTASSSHAVLVFYTFFLTSWSNIDLPFSLSLSLSLFLSFLSLPYFFSICVSWFLSLSITFNLSFVSFLPSILSLSLYLPTIIYLYLRYVFMYFWGHKNVSFYFSLFHLILSRKIEVLTLCHKNVKLMSGLHCKLR